MGVLPLEFPAGQNYKSLGLTGEELYTFHGLDASLTPGADIKVTAATPDGSVKEFVCRSRIDTPVELEYYRNGGILQTVLRKLLNSPK
jgi:aconitate hydratase